VPLEGGGSESASSSKDCRCRRRTRPDDVPFQASGPDYLRAMGIPIIRGRAFTDQDSKAAIKVAIVDETLVGNCFLARIRSANGSRSSSAATTGTPMRSGARSASSSNAHHYGIASSRRTSGLCPFDQLPVWFQQRHPAMSLFVRTSLGPSAGAAIGASSPDRSRHSGLQHPDVKTHLAQDTEQPRLSVMLLSGLGGLALLAVIGIYGVVLFVAQRTEIGVLLGARREWAVTSPGWLSARRPR
jgi:putative ABC transport system permease protein